MRLRRRALGWLVRATICAALITVVLSRIDPDRLVERLRNLDAAWIALILVLALAVPSTAALRWHAVFGALQMPRPRLLFWRLFMSGVFFGTALPYGGEDATRAWLAHRMGLPLASALRGVVIDRALAGCALMLLTLPLLPLTLALLPNPQLRAGAIVAACIGLGIVLSLSLLDLVPLPQKLAALRDRHLGAIPAGLRHILGSGALAIGVLLPACAVHVLRVVAVVVTATALGLHLALGDAFLLVPLALLVASAPITLSGWGLREGIFALVLPAAGIAPSDAVAIAICIGFAGLAVALAGGGPAWLSLRMEQE